MDFVRLSQGMNGLEPVFDQHVYRRKTAEQVKGRHVRTFGELAQWFHAQSEIDENGLTYSKQGENIRPLVNTKIIEGNNSFHGTIATMNNLEWDNFQSECSMSIANGNPKYYIDTRASSLNGFAVTLRPSDDATHPDKIQVVASDGSSLKKNVFYPAISDGDRVFVSVITTGGVTSIVVKYNDVAQSVDTVVTDLNLSSFTPNTSNIYVGRYHLNATLGEFDNQIVDLKVGNSSGFFSHYTIQEDSGSTSYDVLGNSSNISWTGTPNWATPTIPFSAWNNQVGYYLNGSVYIPAANQKIAADGNALTYGSAKYPAQLKSPVLTPNGLGSHTTITGITQSFDSSNYYKFKIRQTMTANASADMTVDSRTSLQLSGLFVLKDASDDLFVRLTDGSGNYVQLIETPSIRTGAEYEIWIKTDDIRIWEDGTELTGGSVSTSGTVSSFSNTNDWVLHQRSDKTDINLSDQSVSDLYLITNNEWYPFQEGAGTASYDVINSTANVTHSNVLWTTKVTWCSHYNSRIGHKHDGTRNVPAKYNNHVLDVLDNEIFDFKTWKLNDTYAEVDFDPQAATELSNLPHDYQIGDSFNFSVFSDKRVYKDAEDRFVYSNTDVSSESNYSAYMDDVA